MFNVPPARTTEFEKLFKQHQLLISGCNVFYHNIRLINGRHRILDRKTFDEYYKNFTADIELKTSPIDSFIPDDTDPNQDTPDEVTPEDLMNERLFYVNRNEEAVPEYGRIKRRVTEADLRETLGETHPVVMALTNHEVTMDDIIDDIFIYWALYKYLDQIVRIRIQVFSNMTPLIEYITNKITLADLKKAIHTDKLNDEKIAKYRSDLMFFAPDIKKICDFYMDKEKYPQTEIKFDLDNLINRVLSNTDGKGDKFIALGMYLIASFAVSDFMTEDPTVITDRRCMDYVRNVLAQA